jgi:putative endonuclease
MFFVYVLNSKSRKYIYVGLTDNTARRISQHNEGKERTTRAYAPFDCIHVEGFATRIEARQCEKYLKSGVGKEWLKRKYSL